MTTMVIKNVNNDNILDIIVTNNENISILFGFGDGTF